MPDFSPDKDRQRSEKDQERSALDFGRDPFRFEREAFIARWVDDNPDLSPEATEHLRQLVMSENGLWNDVENVTGAIEYEEAPGIIMIYYLDEGQELEIPHPYR